MKFVFWGVLFLGVFLRILLPKPDFLQGKKVRITTKVLEEPVVYQSYQKLSLSGLKVYLPKFPKISYGDKVVVEGVVDAGKLTAAKLIKVEESQGLLRKVREKIIFFYQKSLPEPHSSLIAGITLGSKSALPETFWRQLTTSGLAHVVVASGSNVSLVAGFLVGIFTLFLARGRVIPLILDGIWLYALLAGFEAPIVRAAIMGSVAFVAQRLGKVSAAWNALLLSALVMLFFRPEWRGDLGFILSFVATACLLIFQTRIAKAFKALPIILREGLSTSLAAQIGVAPILFVTFGRFNILTPLANALVLWTVPIIMAVSGIAGILGLLIPSLARAILYLIYPLTSWFIFVTRIFGQ
ncbi:MAG: ComEC/Rec2 family competence protein [Patescibacteria group bacterium]